MMDATIRQRDNIRMMAALARAGVIGKGQPRIVASVPMTPPQTQLRAELDALDIEATDADRRAIDAAEAKRQLRAAKKVRLSKR